MGRRAAGAEVKPAAIREPPTAAGLFVKSPLYEPPSATAKPGSIALLASRGHRQNRNNPDFRLSLPILLNW